MESNTPKKWLQGKTVKLVVVIIIVFISGYILGSLTHKKSSIADKYLDKPAVSQKWTCSMHPQIITDKPGKCPICAMDLVPVATELGEVSERQIIFSEDALKLMEIQTAPVQRRLVEAEIRMVGKVDYDETRVKNITAWVPGRIDRLKRLRKLNR